MLIQQNRGKLLNKLYKVNQTVVNTKLNKFLTETLTITKTMAVKRADERRDPNRNHETSPGKNSELPKPPEERTDEKTPLQITASLAAGVLLAVVGGAFQFGYNISVLNAPTEEILDNFYPCEDGDVIAKSCGGEKWRATIYAVVTSAFPLAAVLGSALVATVLRRFNRRNGLLFNVVFSLLAAVLFATSKAAGSIWMLVAGRFFVGVYVGLAAGLVPTYISEISPKQWRGAIGVLNQLFMTLGILVAQIFGLEGVLGSSGLWPLLLALTFVPSLFLLVGGRFMPRSPRHLLLDNNDETAAEKTLVRLRGTSDVKEEMQEIKAERETAFKTHQLTVVELFKERSARRQLLTVVAMHLCQQLGGINAVFFYTNKIFHAAKIDEGRPQDLASIAIGSVNVAMTVVSFLAVERVGRKKLIVFGYASMALSCVSLTACLSALDSQGSSSAVSYLSILFVVAYIVGFAVGPGPVTWLLTSELFTQESRPAAATVACAVNWSSNFLLSLVFPSLVGAAGAFVFVPFTVVCLASASYLHLVLPETKGKTFDEISRMFAIRNSTGEENNF